MKRTKRKTRPGGALEPSGDVARPNFPVVGVGASAGGLESFTEFLRGIPAATGMAFVLIQHLDPTHDSLLTDVLRRATSMPIEEIHDGVRLQPDHVYVIPPNADVGILEGALTVFERKPDARRPFLPIDFFLKALAADRRNQAVGVVLTGMGSDGAAGLRAIKEADGVTFAEDPATAKFSAMPEAAVRAGVVDFVLPIPRLAEELVRIAGHPYLRAARALPTAAAGDPDGAGGAGDDDLELRKIFVLLRSALGADFSDYKRPSLRRRLARRMALRTQGTLREYVDLLERDRGEIDALFEDILIHVTSFFRDGAALDKLKESAFPAILEAKPEGAPIRFWVAGCSTGEEVYSLAICLLEYLADAERTARRPIQIFGTDLSERAVATARAGVYPDSIAQDLSPERLARFFEKLDGGKFRIAKHVRELCSFVRHDLASDPPFSKLDLVSCRNVLIYFNPALQQRVLAAFHFALGLHGFLLLGRTETILEGGPLFTPSDREGKLYARSTTRSTLHLAPTRDLIPAFRRVSELSAPIPAAVEIVRRTESVLLDEYAPPGVVVNDRGEILHFRGRTAPFLEPASGLPQHNVFKMASEGLLAELRIALAQAKETRAKVRRDAIDVRVDGVVRRCNLVVIPVTLTPDSAESRFAVLFEPVAAPQPEPERAARTSNGASNGEKATEDPRVAHLSAELRATKEYLQTIIADHEVINDDLHSSNEELVSSNEELQSLNEELGTAKEELQSTNEELTTLNEELQSRNAELNAVSSDIINILASVEVPIVMVDGAHRIRRFTPKAKTLLNLLPTDLGRPISDIRPNVLVDDLDQQITEVVEGLEMRQSEVQDRDGRWYRLQIRPYTTLDKRIDGAVLSIVDIDALKRAVAAAERVRDFATSTLAAVQTPLLLLDAQLRVVSANDAYYQAFQVPGGQTEQRGLFDVLGGAWDSPQLRAALSSTAASDGHFQRLELELELPIVGRRAVSLSARAVSPPGRELLILLAIEDITERRSAERERARLLEDTEAARAAAEQANRAKDVFLATLSHELRTPLTSLLLQAQLLDRGGLDDARLKRVAGAIQRATRAQAQLIDDLLDVSRIVTGKLRMEPESVRFAALVRAALELVEPTLERKSLELVVELDDAPVVWVDPLRLRQAVWNLLTNAAKFTPSGGTIRVVLDAFDGRARLRVSDTGSGIDAAFLPRIFERFSQEEQAKSAGHGGLGLGLAIARYVAEASGGTLTAESEGVDKGATFTLTLEPTGAPASDVGARLSPAPGRRDIRGVKVLVVDDDLATREALVEGLEASGAEVRAAESVDEALARFEQQLPDVVVSDIAMPDKDGYRLLELLRARDLAHGGKVPVLALTALATAEDRRHALEAGFRLHLAKPIDIDRLVSAIAAVTGDTSAGRAGDFPKIS